MRTMIALAALALTIGCSREPDATVEMAGTAVFFNFYDESVEAYIDDQLVFAERLDVDDDSTGHSKTMSLGLRGCSRFTVVTSTREATQQICPEESGFGVWVSPSRHDGPIEIKFERVFTPGLD